MHAEDLVRISDREFESLCCELLGNILYVDVKQGRPGPDGGIDGLFVIGDDGLGVMQAKHWYNTGVPALKRKLATEEVPKAKKSGATRYVLMTSCLLSPQDRNDFVEMYGGMIHTIADIYGGEDICSLLDKPENEWIKKKHYNLWLTDIDNFERFCGDGTNTASQSVLEDIKEDLRFAVRTKALESASQKLQQDNVIIITGQVGNGKTTLAKQLIADFVMGKGYFLVASTYDLGRFEKQMELHPERKTLFYLDDFLGANTLSVFTNNRDARICNFIRMVKRSGKCKLILTSRTYIVKDALRISLKLSETKILKDEFELSDDRITRIDRANITYSHLYHGDVSPLYKDCIYANENYFRIIDHRNFNPRIVAYCFDASKSQIPNESEAAVVHHVVDFLDNPTQIWKDCFQKLDLMQLEIVLIVFLSTSAGVSIFEDELQLATKRLLAQPVFGTYKGRVFEDVMEQLCASLLTRKINARGGKIRVSYSIFTPSIGDYIISAYGNNADLIADIILLVQNARVAVDLTCKGKWIKGFDEKYSKACKVAFDIVVSRIVGNTAQYDANFLLELFSEKYPYSQMPSIVHHKLAMPIWKSNLWLSARASNENIIRYLKWTLLNYTDCQKDPRLTSDFVYGLIEGISDCEIFLEYKKLCDILGMRVPDNFSDLFLDNAAEWVEDIANYVDSGQFTDEEAVEKEIAERIAQYFYDYSINEDLISVYDCMDGFDASAYVSRDSDSPTSWRDNQDDEKKQKEEEDMEIRRIFRRG